MLLPGTIGGKWGTDGRNQGLFLGLGRLVPAQGHAASEGTQVEFQSRPPTTRSILMCLSLFLLMTWAWKKQDKHRTWNSNYSLTCCVPRERVFK